MVYENASDAWQVWLRTLRQEGALVNPRGQATREVPQLTTAFDMSRDPVVRVESRKLSYVFLAAEAIWIATGDDRVVTIAPFNKHIARFSDDGVTFFGAYGPRFGEQWKHVVDSIVDDRDTRQAVVTFWQKNPPKTKDVPCTVALQWMVRGGQLNCHAYMRSSDAWLGVPYDWFNFTVLSLFVADAVNRRSEHRVQKLGNLYFTAASAHYYLRDEAAIDVASHDRRLPSASMPGDAAARWPDVQMSLFICRDRGKGLYQSGEPYWRIRPLTSG